MKASQVVRTPARRPADLAVQHALVTPIRKRTSALLPLAASGLPPCARRDARLRVTAGLKLPRSARGGRWGGPRRRPDPPVGAPRARAGAAGRCRPPCASPWRAPSPERAVAAAAHACTTGRTARASHRLHRPLRLHLRPSPGADQAPDGAAAVDAAAARGQPPAAERVARLLHRPLHVHAHLRDAPRAAERAAPVRAAAAATRRAAESLGQMQRRPLAQIRICQRLVHACSRRLTPSMACGALCADAAHANTTRLARPFLPGRA